MENNDKFKFVLSDPNKAFTVVLITDQARVGFRPLEVFVGYALCIYPVDAAAAAALQGTFPALPLTSRDRWSQPSENKGVFHRRIFTDDFGDLEDVLGRAVKALLLTATSVEVNPDAPEFVKAIVAGA